MSTHNIGFYEKLSKIILQLSSDITKYPTLSVLLVKLNTEIQMQVLNMTEILFTGTVNLH